MVEAMPMTMKHFLTLFTAALVLMAAGCQRKEPPPRPPMTAFEAEGETAAQAWLHILDEGDYNTALEQCVFKEVTQADPAHTNILQVARAPVGQLKNRALVQINSGAMPLGGGETQKIVQMVYQTDFSTKSECIESITMIRDLPTIWKVGSYNLKMGL